MISLCVFMRLLHKSKMYLLIFTHSMFLCICSKKLRFSLYSCVFVPVCSGSSFLVDSSGIDDQSKSFEFLVVFSLFMRTSLHLINHSSF